MINSVIYISIPLFQTPKVNGVEFDWDKLKNKLSLTFEAMDRQGILLLNLD